MDLRAQVRPAFSVLAVGVLAGTAAAQPAGDRVLEEVVVTAQKRAQDAQRIGIAVEAFQGETLRERGVDQADELSRLATNVNLQNNGGGGAPVLIVRGVGLQNFRINDSPTTAFYVDDVYQTSVASVEWTLLDVDRVEVLKGPQGGLYGRNALGAAVQVISRRPDPEGSANGYVALGVGEHARRELEGAAGFALSDSLALRVAARTVDASGAEYRSVPGGFEHGADDRDAGRISLRMTPGDADLVLRVHGGRDDSELPPMRTVGVYANIGNAAALGAPEVALALLGGLRGIVVNPLCAPVAAGQVSNPAQCATVTGVTPAGYALSGDARRDSATPFRSFLESEWGGASFTADFDVGDYRLQSIGAYDTIDYRRFADFDATPPEHLHIDYNTGIDAWSQEIRLLYEAGETVDWTVGLNYAKDELTEDSTLFAEDGVLPLLFGGAVFSPQQYVQNTRAVAAYGHLEWQAAASWNLVAELRYTDAKKDFVGSASLGFANGAVVPFVGTDDTASFDAFSGKVALEWMPKDDMLVYGSLARGFKTGGYFGGFPTSVEQLAPFDEETLRALEIGVKSEWLDDRVRFNASAYYYDRRDVQQNAGDPQSPINIKRITNIGDVGTNGLELELRWLVSDTFSLDLGIGTVDAEVGDSGFIQAASMPLLPDAPIEGSNIPNYADLSANFAARYEAPFRNGLLGFVQLEGRYRSDQDLSVITADIERGVFEEPGYSVWDIRFGLIHPDDRWHVQAFVTNAADEEYRILARNDGAFGVYELYGLPRMWGFSYNYNWN